MAAMSTNPTWDTLLRLHNWDGRHRVCAWQNSFLHGQAGGADLPRQAGNSVVFWLSWWTWHAMLLLHTAAPHASAGSINRGTAATSGGGRAA